MHCARVAVRREDAFPMHEGALPRIIAAFTGCCADHARRQLSAGLDLRVEVFHSS